MFDFTLIMTIVCFQLRGHGPLSLPEAHLPAARPEQHVRHRGSQGGGTERGQECQQLRRSAPGWGRNTPYPILKSQQKSRAILINFLTLLISQFHSFTISHNSQSVDDLEKELALPASQVMGLFNRSVIKVAQVSNTQCVICRIFICSSSVNHLSYTCTFEPIFWGYLKLQNIGSKVQV